MQKPPLIFEIVSVESYHGFKADERPVSFVIRNKKKQITEIIDRWYESAEVAGHPFYSYFKVCADDENNYILRLNQRFRTWSILFPEGKNTHR